ncbi:MAG: reverse transcriptase domain-containing protein, partial [Rhabdochlamydiaceae bacterium]
YLPSTWREAKIVVLHKPGKPDYTIPKAYRPISLIRTISKGLEKAIAQRISAHLEKMNKLPPMQFGARPRRSTEQALSLLVEAIYRAWRSKRVLSLVTFDVQGAYNGVNKEVLQQRLLEVGIPRKLTEWVKSFCSDRKATITFEGYNSASQEIRHPGLPQGSPFSPILYIIYNQGLLLGLRGEREGEMGFVDDYTAWTTGDLAEENTLAMQEQVIPRITQWEKESGATFETEKTQLIHFTRTPEKAQRPWMPLRMGNTNITPVTEAKVLGVILDNQLRMREHYAYAAKKATQQVIQLGTLRGLSSQAMRQLYLSTVASKMDYAAAIWYKVKDKNAYLHHAFDRVQRIGARVITGAFKTAARATIEAEAGLAPTTIRLQQKAMRFIVNLHTLPPDHPWWDERRKQRLNIVRYQSPLIQLQQEHHEAIAGKHNTPIETIQPFPRQPSQLSVGIQVTILLDREEAEEGVHSLLAPLFVDGSSRKGLSGVAVAWQQNQAAQYYIDTKKTPKSRGLRGGWATIWETVAWQEDANEYAAELQAIRQALRMLRGQAVERLPREVTICTDSQAAIQSIQKTRQQSGQHLIQSILRLA